jgi:adenosylcobinamide kinase / adenosylcobinamide-phosphate guanylyltransferase
VRALLVGTSGADGWPQDGCSCASCMRARSAGLRRAPAQVQVDGVSSPVPGGVEVTSPDGGRLLLAAGPGQVPEPAPGSAPYDIALLDLLASPAQLGQLRAAGFVGLQTTVVAMYCDHRISSEQELVRRCELWGVLPGYDGQLITGPEPARAEAIRPSDGRAPLSALARPHRTLITGGARSGKSTEAELRLAGEPSVTYLAAGPWTAAAAGSASGQPASWIGPDGGPDAEWTDRVARHRARRPPHWRTVESLDIAGALRRETGALLIDGIGTWLAGVMDEAGVWAGDAGATIAVERRIDELIGAWRCTTALVVAVTDQVGSGLVPEYPSGRAFRDQLGWLNQRLAAESEVNLLTVAGLVTSIPA